MVDTSRRGRRPVAAAGFPHTSTLGGARPGPPLCTVSARLTEEQAVVLACCADGTHSEMKQAGGSLIVDPWGTVLAEAGEGEEVLTADVDGRGGGDPGRAAGPPGPCPRHPRTPCPVGSGRTG
ncbi:nitrilase-related carbon-nitrogen hydrolase [Streptomyces sp. NPDC054786]